jgi:hypothetical protein
LTRTARHTGDPGLGRDGGGRPPAGRESKLSPSHRPAASASAAAALGLAIDCHLFKVEEAAGPATRTGQSEAAGAVGADRDSAARGQGGGGAGPTQAVRTAKSGELDDTCKFFIVRVAARTQGLGDCHTVIHWPGNRRLDDASASRTVRSGRTGQIFRISLISTRSDRGRAAAGRGRRRPSAKPGGLHDTCDFFVCLEETAAQAMLVLQPETPFLPSFDPGWIDYH